MIIWAQLRKNLFILEFRLIKTLVKIQINSFKCILSILILRELPNALYSKNYNSNHCLLVNDPKL